MPTWPRRSEDRGQVEHLPTARQCEEGDRGNGSSRVIFVHAEFGRDRQVTQREVTDCHQPDRSAHLREPQDRHSQVNLSPVGETKASPKVTRGNPSTTPNSLAPLATHLQRAMRVDKKEIDREGPLADHPALDTDEAVEVGRRQEALHIEGRTRRCLILSQSSRGYKNGTQQRGKAEKEGDGCSRTPGTKQEKPPQKQPARAAMRTRARRWRRPDWLSSNLLPTSDRQRPVRAQRERGSRRPADECPRRRERDLPCPKGPLLRRGVRVIPRPTGGDSRRDLIFLIGSFGRNLTPIRSTPSKFALSCHPETLRPSVARSSPASQLLRLRGLSAPSNTPLKLLFGNTEQARANPSEIKCRFTNSPSSARKR